jgi:hypothetical protein
LAVRTDRGREGDRLPARSASFYLTIPHHACNFKLGDLHNENQKETFCDYNGGMGQRTQTHDQATTRQTFGPRNDKA